MPNQSGLRGVKTALLTPEEPDDEGGDPVARQHQKTSPARLAVALRRAKAIQMRLDGASYEEIFAAGLGYRSRGAAVQDVQRALVDLTAEPTAELRALEVARMDATLVRLNEREARVLEVRDAEHITVNNGKVIMVPGPDDTMIPLLDDEPVLRATTVLLGIERQRADTQQRRAKLLGLNAPTKVSVITDAALDEELARAAAEASELERLTADEDPDAEEPEGEER